MFRLFFFSEGKGKGKAVPVQAYSGPEATKRSRLSYFNTVGTRRW